EAVDEDARRKVGDDLQRAEAEELSPDQLAEHFLQAAASLAPKLEGKLKPRPIKKVWLNCTKEELFRPRSSRLNRLICAWLLHQHRLEIIPKPGRITGTIPTPDGHVEVQFEEPAAAPLVVRHVILRHGPREDTKLRVCFPDIYQACTDIEAEWRSARQDEDWTKEPLYESHEFDLRTGRIPPLRVDFGPQVGCIVVLSGIDLKGLSLKKRAEL